MKSRKGFLLLEVMVSIVVITGGLLFVMRVYSTAKNVIERSRTLFKESLLLEEKMFGFEEKGEVPRGQEIGKFDDDKEYFWTVDVSGALPDDPLTTDLNTVVLDVYRGKKITSQVCSLTTYLNNKTR